MARRITVEATAYGPPWNAMEGTGITSTGVSLRKGQQKLVVAVDPRVIPYGTKLRIPNNPFGNPNLIFTAADTGDAIKGDRLDFFIAGGRGLQNRWGRRNTTVEIVGRGSPKDVAILGDSAGVRNPALARAASPGPSSTALASARRQAAASWLLSNSKDPLQLVSDVQNAEAQVPVATGTTAPAATSGGGVQSTNDPVAKFVGRANAIDAKRLPYQWGGGHTGRVNAYNAKPLDCSGAVSAVLGINPRVSGQFTKWGKPGDGGNRGVTIYANATHVLMKINGRYWGTSASNPGGGAGWIPASQIGADYLRGFTARHL